jgi:HK97 family phage major capsid protein
MPAPTITLSAATREARERLDAKNAELDAIIEKGIDKLSPEEVEQLQQKNNEATELGKKWETLYAADGIKARRDMEREEENRPDPSGKMRHPGKRDEEEEGEPGEKGGQRYQGKTLGELFTEAKQYLENKDDSDPTIKWFIENYDPRQLGEKATITTAAGFAPPQVRTGRVVESAQRVPVVADLIPQDTTAESIIRYMEETTFTNNAAPVAENAAKPESALAWTERSQPVEVIATWIPVTNQQLEDVAGMQGLINNRLTVMLLLTEDNQLLNGNGTTPNLLGFYNKSGIQTQAKGTDPTPDAIYKAFAKIRNTGMANPTGVVIHPNDWTDIRLLRTADGIYIWGSPAEAGPERIWGVSVVQTTAATEGTALTGDFQLYSHISRRQGIRIDVADQHSDYFTNNKLAIRIEERLSLEIFRASAFCTVTGI